MLMARCSPHLAMKIGNDRRFTIESSWELRQEPAEAPGVFAEAVRNWAGKVGDPFRIPAADGTFTWSEQWFVTEIVFAPEELASLRVTFSGARLGEEPEPVGEIMEKRDSDGGVTRSATWRTSAAGREGMPKPGQPLEWDGGMFSCESCEERDLDGRVFEFTVTGREVSCCALGGVVRGKDEDGVSSAEQSWFVGTAEADGFFSSHAPGTAAEWGGTNFFLDRVESKAHGVIGFDVTLTAREVSTRLLSAVRREEFFGFSSRGVALREIIWNTVHQVRPEDLAGFYGLVGTDGSSWSEAGCIVTRVVPEVRSPAECRIELELQHRANPGLYTRRIEENSDLPDRLEYAVDTAEFHLSAEMAGYRRAPGGGLLPIAGWNASGQCPFSTNNVLPVNCAESTLRTLEITETSYRPGDTVDNMPVLAEWIAVRVESATIAGCSGSFLRDRQSSSEVVDDSGEVHTRIRRTFLLAPGGFSWNADYWSRH